MRRWITLLTHTVSLFVLATVSHAESIARLECAPANDVNGDTGLEGAKYCKTFTNGCSFNVALDVVDNVTHLTRSTGSIAPGQRGSVCTANTSAIDRYFIYRISPNSSTIVIDTLEEGKITIRNNLVTTAFSQTPIQFGAQLDISSSYVRSINDIKHSVILSVNKSNQTIIIKRIYENISKSYLPNGGNLVSTLVNIDTYTIELQDHGKCTNRIDMDEHSFNNQNYDRHPISTDTQDCTWTVD